jgi:hypothetical protein
LRNNLNLDGQEGIRGNDARYTRLSISQVWSYTKPPPAAHPHSFHSIEEPREHELPVDAQSGE